MATSRPRDLDRETYSALKAAQESSQLPSSVNPFKTALSGPTWFVKTIKFDNDAFKVAATSGRVTLLDLSVAAAGNPEQRNDVIIYDAFLDVTTLWAHGGGSVTAQLGLDKGTRNDASGDFSTADPNAILEPVSIDHANDVAFLQGDAKADKGDLLPSAADGAQFSSYPVVDKPRFCLDITAGGNLGDGTTTTFTAGELRAYFCIATPVSLDADSGFGVVV